MRVILLALITLEGHQEVIKRVIPLALITLDQEGDLICTEHRRISSGGSSHSTHTTRTDYLRRSTRGSSPLHSSPKEVIIRVILLALIT